MEKKLVPCLVVSILILCSLTLVRSDASDNRYKVGEDVPLYVNKVGPFHNPSETYRYFDLPFCSSGPTKDKKEALGELLNGDRLVTAPYKLDFLSDKDSEIACKKKLTKEQVAQFREAISKDYYFQMYYDDLPIWGFIGKVEKEGKNDPSEYKYYLLKHLHFTIFYNKDRVIEITALSDPKNVVDLTEDKEVNVEFMYSVKWKETEIPYENRMEKYSHSSSLPHHLEIHWFSIINSCVTVLLLTGFLATILMRVLKNDFVKYAHDEESAEDQEETGWKYIHGDVFRYPKYKSVLAAAVGSGTQLFTLTFFIFLLALVGVFYPYNRGALFTALVVIYALTAGIAGYTAASFFCQLEGTNWVRNLLLTGGLSSVVDQLDCSFMAIACITTLQDRICPASCKPHFSLATWPAFVMVSSSCLAPLVSVLLYFLSATFTVQSSANSKSYGLHHVQISYATGGDEAGGLEDMLWDLKGFMHCLGE
ncbi:hypothetical protein D5086_008346 [Populus alba]|uniref:Uncharacterized protein n=1 Tax=Populus alba TaxID=43335 RepID=A0ACC4CGK8_POPAL